MRLRAGLVALVATAVLAGPVVTAMGQPETGASTATQTRPQGVVVTDVKIPVPHQPSIDAYVVRPTGRLAPHSQAGVLWLHWLGQIHNDRTEYLAEAITLAGQGVVSVLPQGYFPWVPDPDGTTNDVTLVELQVDAMQAALDRLVATRAVDRSRIAIVGHDYGAMYGALVADRDHRVDTLVLEAPDATWGNWFALFWLGLEGQAYDDYLALFEGLDPVEHTARLGEHVLFQWAGEDFFVPEAVRDAYAASSPNAQVLLYERADHQLTDQAMFDRDAFLARELDLGAS
ncbi:MAG: alpha/beta fold hydrolase [Jiangellaceae bacterium]